MSDLGNKQVMAKNLAYYIEKSGKSQRELSEIVGVATSTFNNWVKGHKYPRIDKIEILAEYFGIQKSDLIEEKKETPEENSEVSENQRLLIEFAKSVPEEKAGMILQVMKTILGDEK